VRWFFRPEVWPVWNHHIRGPVRIYSTADGPDEDALTALAHGHVDHLRLPAPSAAERREHVDMELDTALQHLRAVHQHYWDRDWRREHKGFGIDPETHLWNAVWGYLDLHDATQQHRE
jgi:CheY-like chemotaxis protein